MSAVLNQMIHLPMMIRMIHLPMIHQQVMITKLLLTAATVPAIFPVLKALQMNISPAPAVTTPGPEEGGRRWLDSPTMETVLVCNIGIRDMSRG